MPEKGGTMRYVMCVDWLQPPSTVRTPLARWQKVSWILCFNCDKCRLDLSIGASMGVSKLLEFVGETRCIGAVVCSNHSVCDAVVCLDCDRL